LTNNNRYETNGTDIRAVFIVTISIVAISVLINRLGLKLGGATFCLLLFISFFIFDTNKRMSDLRSLVIFQRNEIFERMGKHHSESKTASKDQLEIIKRIAEAIGEEKE